MQYLQVIHMTDHSELVPIYHLIFNTYIIGVTLESNSFHVYSKVLVEEYIYVLIVPKGALVRNTCRIDITLWLYVTY